jgi:hypothetical protein
VLERSVKLAVHGQREVDLPSEGCCTRFFQE